MKKAGGFILGFALVLCGYAIFFYDPTVSTGYGSTYNIGKLNFQQNLVMAAGASAVVGVLMILFGAPGDSMKCKSCSEVIRAGAAVCKHCGSHQKGPWTCPKCNESNLAVNSDCSRCGGWKPLREL